MAKRIRKHSKRVYTFKKQKTAETLYAKTGNIFLNKAQEDRISFSVLKDDSNSLRKIENISYEIYIDGKWEWVVRYDDHGGVGLLHRHVRVSLADNREIESSDGIKKYKNKDYELTWVINDIKRNYFGFRKKLLKGMGLDLY